MGICSYHKYRRILFEYAIGNGWQYNKSRGGNHEYCNDCDFIFAITKKVNEENHMTAKGYEFKEFYIPDYMVGAIDRYIKLGVHPGDFLFAVVTNNLKEAVIAADDINLKNIPAYVSYFYNEAPSQCWGSAQKVNAWMKNLENDARAWV